MSDSRGSSWPLIAVVAACAILAVPVWLVASPPMPDYPAHLASFYLIGGGASHFYKVQWAFLPNLAAEVLVPVLANVMPLEIALKLFLTVTIGLWVVGPAAIQRALYGRLGLGALLAIPFAYNAPFMWGFFNYTFAVGVSFVVFAAWIATDGKRGAVQSAGFALAFTLIYFSHLFALATLAVMVVCFELSDVWQWRSFSVRDAARRLAAFVLLCLPAVFSFLFLKPGGDGLSVKFDLLGSWADRFLAAMEYGFDQPAYALLAIFAVIFAAGLYTKRLTIAPRLSLLLPVLAVCTLLMPEWALGGWGVQLRLPAVLGAVAFAAADIKLARRWEPAAVVSLVGLFAFQSAILAIDWHRIDARYSEFRQAGSAIKRQSRLMTVLDGDSLGWSSDQPYWHMAEFEIIDRDAFTPLLFATRGQHVVQVLPPMRAYAAQSAQQGSPPDIDELNDLAAGRIDADEDIRDILPYLQFFQCHFDQAVVIHGDGPLSKVPAMLRLRHRGSFFAIYDIVSDQRCAAR